MVSWSFNGGLNAVVPARGCSDEGAAAGGKREGRPIAEESNSQVGIARREAARTETPRIVSALLLARTGGGNTAKESPQLGQRTDRPMADSWIRKRDRQLSQTYSSISVMAVSQTDPCVTCAGAA